MYMYIDGYMYICAYVYVYIRIYVCSDGPPACAAARSASSDPGRCVSRRSPSLFARDCFRGAKGVPGKGEVCTSVDMRV